MLTGRCHLAAAALLLTVGLSACAGGTGPTPSLQPSPSRSVPAPSPRTTSPAIVAAFTAPSILHVLSCSGSRFAWVGINARGEDDGIWTAKLDGSDIRSLAERAHGGSIGFTALAGDWVVYIEWQTDLEDVRGKAWYLEAVNALTGRHIELARSDAATAVEIPQPSTAGTTVVWDQLTDAGPKVVLTYDLASGVKAQVPLPSSVYPVRPYLDGSQLVFLDDASIPNRTQLTWLFRPGYVTLFDLQTHRLTRLPTPITAYYLEVSGGIGTYIVRRPQTQPTDLYRIDLQPGAVPVAVGPGETPMYRTTSGIVTYVTELHHMREYRFGGATTDLPDTVDFGYATAPCAGSLYFVQGTPTIYKLPL